MTFVSFAFAALFALTLLARFTFGRTKQSPAYLHTLLLFSLVFYGWHIPAYTVILLFSATIDWLAAKKISETNSAVARKVLIWVSMSVNLGLLGFFKYADFAIGLWSELGLGPQREPLGIILPIGISFYTFQSMSYTIDVYRGHFAPTKRFRDFLLGISFFPQLVAGPIVRARDIMPQIHRRRGIRTQALLRGAELVIQGLFLKVVLADNLAPLVDARWPSVTKLGNARFAFETALLFSGQILSDFAGYSSIALGLAYLLGFQFRPNFDNPYIATSFREFWTRWHISLSTWLRDYLYVPLGGNRQSKARTLRNLMLVMLIGGLWHGAAIHFVIWGGIHGLGLVVERVIGFHRPGGRLRALLWGAVVQGTVLVTWVFFRAESTSQAADFVLVMGAGAWDAGPSELADLIWLLPLFLMHARAAIRLPATDTERSALTALMFYACVTAYGPTSDFIYFQF
ncbi:MAG: MBOAT family protein [Deltaproteobacteria bacterium]|nr:MBOAT family protein [Deltaproteobacteria bacterium]